MQAADQQKLTRAAAAAAVDRSSAALVHLLGHEEMVKMKVVSTQSGLEPGQHFSGNFHSRNRLAVASASPGCPSTCAHAQEIEARLSTGKAKTPPKWRTQEWHLSDAVRAPRQPAQIHMQEHAVQAADQEELS